MLDKIVFFYVFWVFLFYHMRKTCEIPDRYELVFQIMFYEQKDKEILTSGFPDTIFYFQGEISQDYEVSHAITLHKFH